MLKSIVVMLTGLVIGVATAADIKVAMRPVTSFGYLDTDKDARITPSEAKADWAVAQGFERADANRDGALDKDEFATLSKI
jgi:EF hand